MTNKNKPIRQKEPGERNKEVWVLKDLDGNILEKFRQHQAALKEKSRREKLYFGIPLILERDNSYIENLKKNLNDKKRNL